MRRLHLRVGGLAFLAWGLLIVATPAWAQRDRDRDREDRGGKELHTLTIYNGSERTVQYYGKGLSADEQASLKELQDARNDLARARYNESHPATSGSYGMAGGGVIPAAFPAAFPVSFATPGMLAAPYLYPRPWYLMDLVERSLSDLDYVLSDSMPLFPAALPYEGWGYSYYAPRPLAVATAPAVAPGPQVLNLRGGEKAEKAPVRGAAEERGARNAAADAEKRLRRAEDRAARSDFLRKELHLREGERRGDRD